MARKLTLSLDEKVIDAAKRYSEKKGISISKLVEEYLRKIMLSNQKKKHARSSLLSIKGALGKVPSDFDYKEERDKYLADKYK